MPRWGASNEYPQHMFSWRNKKNILWIPPLIWSYANSAKGKGRLGAADSKSPDQLHWCTGWAKLLLSNTKSFDIVEGIDKQVKSWPGKKAKADLGLHCCMHWRKDLLWGDLNNNKFLAPAMCLYKDIYTLSSNKGTKHIPLPLIQEGQLSVSGESLCTSTG